MAFGQDTCLGYPTRWIIHSRQLSQGNREGEEFAFSSTTNDVLTHFSPVLEYLMVKCQPFQLLNGFSAVIMTVVNIPPQDLKYNKMALNKLY
jgi:hypothetical protein